MHQDWKDKSLLQYQLFIYWECVTGYYYSHNLLYRKNSWKQNVLLGLNFRLRLGIMVSSVVIFDDFVAVPTLQSCLQGKIHYNKCQPVRNHGKTSWGRALLFYFLTISLPRSQNPPHIIYDLYNQVGYNCFIAAGIYMLVAVLSFCQIKLNKCKEYMVH